MEWSSVSTSKHSMLLHTSTWSRIVFSADIRRNMCYLKRDTAEDLHISEIRKWSFLNALRVIVRTWKEISPNIFLEGEGR
jgi:hypothetical protein